MIYFVQQAINAIQLGSIYALIALGYSMVYGVLTMINFAHGDIFMVGAFLCLLVASLISLPFPIILIIVMVGTGLLGALIERLAYRPLRNAPRVSAIITALGCGLVIEYTTLSLSPYSKPMPMLFR
ncbi:MAG TPA: branched-chain amino acid ABC transporter permease, partial [Terrimicrobiaceae bacterium]